MYDLYERIHFDRVNPIYSNFMNPRDRKKRNLDEEKRNKFREHLAEKLREKEMEHIDTFV